MRVDFDWNESNVKHVGRHGVTPTEAEQAILDPNVLMVELQSHQEEERFKAVGATAAGRILAVVFTLRGEAIRPVTAYDAPPREQRLYLKQRGR